MNIRMHSGLCLVGLGIAAVAPSFGQEAPRARTANNRLLHLYKMPGGSYLGIGVAEIDIERAKALNLKEVHGVEVKSVDEESPASKAGLKEGDVVLEYNGQRIEGTEQFVRLVRETPVDRQVRLSVWRNGASQTLNATIGRRSGSVFHTDDDEDFAFAMPAMPPIPPMPEVAPMPEATPLPDMPRALTMARTAMLGIESETLTPQLAEFFGVKQGVLVRSVLKNSAAEKAGMKAGDVVIKVDGEAVSNSREITSSLRSARGKKAFPIVVVRDKKQITLSVTLEAGTGMRGVRPVFSAGRSC